MTVYEPKLFIQLGHESLPLAPLEYTYHAAKGDISRNVELGKRGETSSAKSVGFVRRRNSLTTQKNKGRPGVDGKKGKKSGLY